jgi:glycerol-3-phosphate dehydrogenase (NAD+)
MSVLGVGSTGHKMKDRVAVIGSGNWGTAVGKLVAENTARHSTRFFKDVKMWTFEELIDEEKLTDIINMSHENVKYLPGRALPNNLIAVPDLEAVVADANLLVFVLPPQFLARLLPTIKSKLMKGTRAISLIKGLSFDDKKGVVLISDILRNGLGKNVDVSVLQGANVANEVADNHFCEATLGYTVRSNAESFFYAFNTPTFRVQLANDPIGVELWGGLKSIVGLGAGMCDGLNYASNSKAAIIRMGVKEMM